VIRVLLFLLCLLPGVAGAHGVHLAATARGGAVLGTARFADGTPMSESVVELRAKDRDAESPAFIKTRTLGDGRFAFPAPLQGGEFTLIVDDGIGHRGEVTLRLTAASAGSPTGTVQTPPPPWGEWASGLGYLLGIFGLASWWLAARERRRSRA